MAHTERDSGAAVETLARARLPLAWAALVASVLVPFAAHQLPGMAGAGTLDAVIGATGDWAAPAPALLVLVLVLVCVLWRPLGRDARPLALTAALIVTLSVVANVAGSIWMAVRQGPLGLWGVGYAIPTLFVAITLWIIQAGLTEPASVAAAPTPRELEADVPLHQRPTWSPDQASGAAWQSASGAAQGGQASGWGAPGRPRGSWEPAPEVESRAAEQAAEEKAALDAASAPRPGGGQYSAKSWTSGGADQRDAGSGAEQSGAEQSDAEQSDAEQSGAARSHDRRPDWGV